jgi:hypothetical protein
VASLRNAAAAGKVGLGCMCDRCFAELTSPALVLTDMALGRSDLCARGSIHPTLACAAGRRER